MPSISEIQSGADAALEPPRAQESPGVATGASVSDGPAGSGDAVPEPQSRPKICDLEWQREGMPDTEFNRTYPPDAWGEETANNARVWNIYRDRQTVADKGMLDGWNKTLDVLLIFAGLFSAVLTAFLIESYKTLQPDYTQYMATFLYAAAISHNRTGAVFPPLEAIMSPDRFIQTSTTQRWTNGLWFFSLVISLSVALLCILIKQWLAEYESNISSGNVSPRYWAQRYCLYHRGLKTWGVPVLISFLPLLLHLSLFLFFAGLILFLGPLDGAISYSLLVLVLCIAAFYTLSLFLPAWRVDCPSYTPLLAHALMAMSPALSVLVYVCHSRKAKHWLQSIQLLARQQLARETRTISKCDQELDGHVLSALVHLPIDTNPDVVHAACTAVCAVTSTRTMDTITRKVRYYAFVDQIAHCHSNLPPTETGFAITAYAQLRRAHQAMSVHHNPLWPDPWAPKRAPDLVSSLGIDGLLLHKLDGRRRDWPQFDIHLLIRQLQTLPPAGERACDFPLRGNCLIFLGDWSRIPNRDRAFLPCFLLVFCAGRFASADLHELVRALRGVETALRMQCSITLPAHNGGEEDYIRAVVNGLWIMLADYRRYSIDTLTAQLVSHQAIACFNRVSPTGYTLLWAQLSGLPAFVLSPNFGQCMGIGDSLAQYISVFCENGRLDGEGVQLQDYWTCTATLLKLGWNCTPRRDDKTNISMIFDPFPIELPYFLRTTRLGRGGWSAMQDVWYEPALSALLDSPCAISTWEGANLPDNDDDDTCILNLRELAWRIGTILRRRQRLHLDNDAFIRGFFAGSFLLARFQNFASREHTLDEERRGDEERDLLNLAKHSLALSPESLISICTSLEQTGEADSELRARAVDLSRRIRDGSMPGGALAGECHKYYCLCMPYDETPVPSIRMRLDELVARFRPRRNASATSPNV